MLDAVSKGIEKILDFFSLIWDLAKSLVSDIINMSETLIETVKSIPDYFSWLPAELVVSVVALFGIVIIYKVLGREG